MTPTQAQIGAAAKAVEEAYKCYGTEFTTIAICALTAAAGVGEQTHLVSEIHRQHKEIERLKVQVIERDSAIAGWIKREAATIERCARVAELMEIRGMPKGFAAALRALKDS